MQDLVHHGAGAITGTLDPLQSVCLQSVRPSHLQNDCRLILHRCYYIMPFEALRASQHTDQMLPPQAPGLKHGDKAAGAPLSIIKQYIENQKHV